MKQEEQKLLDTAIERLKSENPGKAEALEVIVRRIWADSPSSGKTSKGVSDFCDLAVMAYESISDLEVDMTDLQAVEWHIAHFFEIFDDNGNPIE
jgi:hypothetical protein